MPQRTKRTPLTASLRPQLRPRVARRGGTGTKVLLILSAIFLVTGAIGGFVMWSAIKSDFKPLADRNLKDLRNSKAISHVVAPGESTMTFDGEGGMALVVADRYEHEGKEYTFAPGGKLNFTLKGSDGKEIDIAKPGRGQPIDLDTEKLHLVGFVGIPKADTYTLAVDGQETVVHAVSLTGSDWQQLLSGFTKLMWGGLAGCCGIPLFALFGIIGGIMMIFGKKPAPMP